VSAAETVMNK